MEQSTSQLTRQVSEASDKIAQLTDEIRFVAHEKSVLQGQLKQLQSSATVTIE